ncbi:MAG TPA: histidine kinase [Chitinophagaceae bacterium]|nr:histidine kinase [Chitinophagaceae bacterium]
MIRQFYIADNRLLTHILFWAGYMLVYTGVHFQGGESFLYYFLVELPGLPAAMLVAYINMYVLYPRFFYKKKYLAYCVSALLLLFAGAVLSRIIQERVTEPLFLPEETHPDSIFVWYMLFKGMLWFLSPVLLLTLVIRIFKQWFAQEQLQQEVEKEKLNAELNFLKAQVHPHFLFNTLNNLYSLTLHASPAAPLTVLKLSELMSYMLYDSQSDMVPLNKEIKHIRNYIELETIRYGNRLDVSVNVSGDITGKRIAPLLLIPFAENAFKHGVSNEMDKVWVTIDIKEKAGWLNVKVENSLTDDGIAPTGKNTPNGIGLQNVLRRLQLLYPKTHQVELKKEPDRYMVDLKIKIA